MNIAYEEENRYINFENDDEEEYDYSEKYKDIIGSDYMHKPFKEEISNAIESTLFYNFI